MTFIIYQLPMTMIMRIVMMFFDTTRLSRVYQLREAKDIEAINLLLHVHFVIYCDRRIFIRKLRILQLYRKYYLKFSKFGLFR